MIESQLPIGDCRVQTYGLAIGDWRSTDWRSAIGDWRLAIDGLTIARSTPQKVGFASAEKRPADWPASAHKPLADFWEARLARRADFGIDEAIGHITATNCYNGWEPELRYLMFRYEEHLAREQGLNFKNEQWEKIWLVSPSESIEHVWSQKKAPEKHKHRLGNLVLLPPKLRACNKTSSPRPLLKRILLRRDNVDGYGAPRCFQMPCGIWSNRSYQFHHCDRRVGGRASRIVRA